jgi:hypothetical protein
MKFGLMELQDVRKFPTAERKRDFYRTNLPLSVFKLSGLV